MHLIMTLNTMILDPIIKKWMNFFNTLTQQLFQILQNLSIGGPYRIHR